MFTRLTDCSTFKGIQTAGNTQLGGVHLGFVIALYQLASYVGTCTTGGKGLRRSRRKDALHVNVLLSEQGQVHSLACVRYETGLPHLDAAMNKHKWNLVARSRSHKCTKATMRLCC